MGPTWQGTEGSLLPVVSERPSPQSRSPPGTASNKHVRAWGSLPSGLAGKLTAPHGDPEPMAQWGSTQSPGCRETSGAAISSHHVLGYIVTQL